MKIARETNTPAKEVMRRHAMMILDKNDALSAAQTYLEMGDFSHAISLAAQAQKWDKLYEMTQSISDKEVEVLKNAAELLANSGHLQYSAAIQLRLGNYEIVLDLYMDNGDWKEALRIADEKPELGGKFYLPYANHLAAQDKYTEAQSYYRRAGRMDLTLKVLKQLTDNAIDEERFGDAAHYMFTLYEEYSRSNEETTIDYRHLSNLYYAFQYISKFIDQPFTDHLPEYVFNAALYIHQQKTLPTGVSRTKTLLTLSKLGRNFSAFTVCKNVNKELLGVVLSKRQMDSVLTDHIILRTLPHTDSEDLCPTCYQCSMSSPLENPSGTNCFHCKEPYIFSQFSYRVLPVVEFVLEDGFTTEEALNIINTAGSELDEADDPFSTQLLGVIRGSEDVYSPISVPQDILRQCAASSIRVFRPIHGDPRFFKIVLSDALIEMCERCGSFWDADDWEFLRLLHNGCPFCRQPVSDV